MQTFSVEIEDRSSVESASVTLARAGDLATAMSLLSKSPSGAYVVYLPGDLQRRVFGGRIVWLDSYGRESEPPPRHKA